CDGRRPATSAGRAAEELALSSMNVSDLIFERLMAVIEDRKRTMPEHSYTTKLFAGGADKIGEKIREEAAEVIEAADEPGDEGHKHLGHGAADLVYHLFVRLAHREVQLGEVEAELARRFGISGLDEKAGR